MYVQAQRSSPVLTPTSRTPNTVRSAQVARDSYAPVVGWLRTSACNTGLQGGLREPRRLAMLHQGGDPDVVAGLVRDNLRFAHTDTERALLDRVRASAREAGVTPRELESTSAKVMRDLEELTVARTMRAPVSRALFRGLTLRNAELEGIANDPRSSREQAMQARWDMRENDVLMHRFENGSMTGDLYAIDPELTRRVIGTDSAGLPSVDYPFAGAHGQTFAQSALLREVRDVQAYDGKTARLLQQAARATREVSPDLLELLDAPGLQEASCR